MADDLDDFFNDIEEVEKEVIAEEANTNDDDNKPNGAAEHEATTLSSNQDGIKNSEDTTNETSNDAKAESDGPPTKKVKTEKPAAPIRPRGMIVAASSSVVLKKPATVTEDQSNNYPQQHNHQHQHPSQLQYPYNSSNRQMPSIPPPPPPPMPNTNAASIAATTASSSASSTTAKKPVKRMAAGKVWVDPTLDEWPENDFRIFCGNLDKSTTDTQLHEHFQKYTSIAKAKIVKDGAGMSKGFGFVSFLQPLDCAKAIREMDQTWLGSRPIRIKRSDWKDRNLNEVRKKSRKESKQRKRFGL